MIQLKAKWPDTLKPKNISWGQNVLIPLNCILLMTKHISCNCKSKFNNKTCNSNQKWNSKACQCEFKNYQCKKYYTWNPGTCTSENSKYLKNIADTSVIACDELYLLWILYQEK